METKRVVTFVESVTNYESTLKSLDEKVNNFLHHSGEHCHFYIDNETAVQDTFYPPPTS